VIFSTQDRRDTLDGILAAVSAGRVGIEELSAAPAMFGAVGFGFMKLFFGSSLSQINDSLMFDSVKEPGEGFEEEAVGFDQGGREDNGN